MALTDGGLSIADAMALAKDDNGDGGFGGGGMGMMMLLFFILILGGGNGGLMGGNRDGGVSPAANMINNDFLYTNLNSSLDRGFTQLANQNFGMQQSMNQGFSGVDASLCAGFNSTQRELMENRFAAQQCCCETNRNIDSVRYENAKNTCDIITSSNMNTRDLLEANNLGVQRILDFMTNDKIEALRSELQSAQLTLSNAAQTNNIINAVRPFPTPSYVTCSPYTAMNGFGTCGNCGCN